MRHELKNERFVAEHGHVIAVQVPGVHVQEIVDAVLIEADLKYGDYDRVTFQTSPGVQTFRSLPGGRNAATEDTVSVACVELSFFVSGNEAILLAVLRAVYRAHPYEEPVVFVTKSMRTLHIRGLDESNPNKFWNRAGEDWIPTQHQS